MTKGSFVKPIGNLTLLAGVLGIPITLMLGGAAALGGPSAAEREGFYRVEGLLLIFFAIAIVGGFFLTRDHKVGFLITSILYAVMPVIFIFISGLWVLTSIDGLIPYSIFSFCSLGIAFYLFKNNP